MAHVIARARSRLVQWQLARRPGVELSAGARVDARRIDFRAGCALRVGPRSIVEATIDFERAGAELVVGENSYVGASMFKCAERIEIGDDVEVAWNCTIVDHDWESLVWELRRVDMRDWYSKPKDWQHVPRRAVRIGDRALVGFNSVILKGVHVGEGAVVGVQSVVTNDVPPYTVVAGAPARVVRRLDATAAQAS